MTKFKHLDDLTDSEKYDIRTFVEAAESKKDKQEQLESSYSSSNMVENEDPIVDPNITYAITSDDETVTVYDDKGNPVFHTTMADWEENREYYYETYRLGTS